MVTALGLLAVLALILANGYFVTAEFAYVAARRTKLEELALGGSKRARRALQISGRLSFVLSGAQLGITATSLVVGYIAEPVFGRALSPLLLVLGVPEGAVVGIAFTTGFIVATATQMVLGELGPKNLAIAAPERFALVLSGSTWLYTRLAGPIIRVFDSSSNRLLRAIGIEPAEELDPGVSAEELEFIIHESSREGALGDEKAALLRRTLEFRSLRAQAVMVPRPQVEWLPAEASCAELQRLSLATGHSRFPAVGEGLDDVKGVVQVQDLLPVPVNARKRTPVRTLLKPALAVPESALLGPLLSDMREAHTQLAVVVDEHGGTAGIITLEDIVEELVGSIQDEYDPAEPAVQPQADGSYLVPGAWRVDECERDTGITLPDGDYDTVGGLVMAELGRVPDVGDRIVVVGAAMQVEAMDGHAVARVRLTASGDGATPGAESRS
ncbi:MAG: hemolysin family protein [Egibacteraceae bacterium]